MLYNEQAGNITDAFRRASQSESTGCIFQGILKIAVAFRSEKLSQCRNPLNLHSFSRIAEGDYRGAKQHQAV